MSPDRRDELSVDEALGSLAPVDAVELRALAVDGHDATVALTAALGVRALAPGGEELPASVRARLRVAADRFEANRAESSLTTLPKATRSPTPVPGMVTTTAGAQVIVVPMYDAPVQFDFARWAGWLVAVASVAALLALTLPKRSASAAEAATPLQSLPAVTVRPLLDDAVTVPLTGANGVEGAFVWSRGGQAGHLDVRGLPALDPTREVFQLWLVDGARQGEVVAVGLFNAGSGSVDAQVDVAPLVRVTDPRELRLTRESAAGALWPTGPIVARAGF